MTNKCNYALRNALYRAVVQAGHHARTSWRRNLSTDLKSPKDLVTQVDKTNERRIREAVRRADQTIGFYGEETGGDRSSPRFVSVDPLDATTNYILGLPLYSVMAALIEAGAMEYSVTSIPELSEVYVASLGGGATMNNRKIHVGQVDRLSAATISCNRSNYPDDLMPKGLEIIERLMRHALSWRNFGTAGVEYAWVASGKLDGIINPLAEPVHAAGYLLMQEAGAKVTDHLGDPITLDSKTVVAANPRLHEQLLELVRGVF